MSRGVISRESEDEMAPSPDDANQATAVTAAVTDASDAPSPPKQPVPPPPPPLPPIATLASDPRTAFSAKGRRREESCQTATKSCDRRQVDFSSVSRLSRLQHFTFALFLVLHRGGQVDNFDFRGTGGLILIFR